MREHAAYSSEEMMAIAAARRFRDGATCFVGVGLPSTAACLARAMHAPNATLVYESGAIGSKPRVTPLSVADPELADTAVVITSTNEIFGYWLQAGRIDIGFLGAAQIDRFGNINSTVIGDYVSPKRSFAGCGRRATHYCKRERNRGDCPSGSQYIRAEAGFHDHATCCRPDDGHYRPRDSGSGAWKRGTGLTCRYQGVTADQIRQSTGWPLRFTDDLRESPAPEPAELRVLRDLNARTKWAHEGE